MSYASWRRRSPTVKERTDAPFGVNLRADQPDAAERADLLIREGVRVASFALAPKPELIARLKDGGVLVVPSIGARAPRREGRRLGRRRGRRPGRRGRRSHRRRSRPACCCPQVVGRRRHPGDRRGRLLRRPRPGRGARLRRRRASRWARASCSRRRARSPTRSSSSTSARRSPTPSSPPRSTACRSGCCAAAWSRGSSATSPARPAGARGPQRRRLPAPLGHQLAGHGPRGPGDEALARAELEPGGDGGQRADALPRRPARRAHRRRRHRQRPGRRPDRRRPQLRRADRADRRRGGRHARRPARGAAHRRTQGSHA